MVPLIYQITKVIWRYWKIRITYPGSFLHSSETATHNLFQIYGTILMRPLCDEENVESWAHNQGQCGPNHPLSQVNNPIETHIAHYLTLFNTIWAANGKLTWKNMVNAHFIERAWSPNNLYLLRISGWFGLTNVLRIIDVILISCKGKDDTYREVSFNYYEIPTISLTRPPGEGLVQFASSLPNFGNLVENFTKVEMNQTYLLSHFCSILSWFTI